MMTVARADLKSGRLKFIETSFIKPRHGDGNLTSINFSETRRRNREEPARVAPGHHLPRRGPLWVNFDGSSGDYRQVDVRFCPADGEGLLLRN